MGLIFSSNSNPYTLYPPSLSSSTSTYPSFCAHPPTSVLLPSRPPYCHLSLSLNHFLTHSPSLFISLPPSISLSHSLSLPEGTVTYFPDRDAIIWSIKQYSGSKEYLMRAHFGLPSITGTHQWGVLGCVYICMMLFFGHNTNALLVVTASNSSSTHCTALHCTAPRRGGCRALEGSY